MRFILLVFFMILVSSCYKYIKVDNSLRYSVNGVSDITLDQNDSVSEWVEFQLISGDPSNEYIHCYVSGLPANVSCSYDTTAFRPNYAVQLSFASAYPTAGTYPAKLVVISPSKGIVIYPLNIKITSVVDCTSEITTNKYGTGGNQPTVMADTPGGVPHSLTALIARTGADTLSIQVYRDTMIYGVQSSEYICYYNAVLNCNDNTFLIYPQQQIIGPGAVRGSGQYTSIPGGHYQITLTDTAYSGNTFTAFNTVNIYN